MMEQSAIDEKVLKYESFVNDVLKEDLKVTHENLDKKNAEIAEWTQLRTTLTTLEANDLSEGFKTKMDIGTNVYVQAEVPDASKVFINIGAGVYVEYSLKEALNFIKMRLELLNRQADIIKQESFEIKARIKLVLHGIQELMNIK